MNKAEDFVEDKIEDIKESGVKEKLEAFADKVEDKTEDAVSKMKEFGKKAAAKTADKLEDIAENIKKKTDDAEEAGECLIYKQIVGALHATPLLLLKQNGVLVIYPEEELQAPGPDKSGWDP